MSKNLTRKGLAFGALVALTASVVAGAPAHAAGEVVFEPTTGTTYNTFTTLDFALSASLAPGQVAGNIAQLKYEIAGGTTGAVEYTVGAAAAAAATATTSATQVVSAGAPAVGTANVLNIGLAAAAQAAPTTTATKSVTVTAFIDSDNDSTVDAGEFQQARTVTFVKPSEVTATTTFTKPTLGGNTFTATVALSGDINARQAAAAVSVEFFKAGVSIADTNDTADSTGTVLTAAQRTNPIVSAWDSTGSALKAVLYAEDDAAGADTAYTAYSTTAGTFSAQAIVAGVASGTSATQVAAAATIDNISVAATNSADAKSTTKGVRDLTPATTTAGAATVRTGKDVTVVATILKSDDAVVASESVTVTATGTGIATDTVTVNGNAVVDAAKTFTATTDASGKISIAIVGATADNGDTVTLSIAAQGITSSNYVVTWNDATYAVFNLGNTLDAAVTVASKGSLAVEYLVADQWGQGISGDYRLNVTRSGATGRTTAATWNYTPVLTAGKASFTIVDNGAGASTGADTVAIAVEKAVAGGGYAAQAITANLFDEFDINYVAAAAVPTAVSATATATTPNVTTTAVAAANLYYEVATAPGHADVTHVYGAVTQADGSAVAGAVVTVSAAGLGFQPVVADGSGTATEGNNVFTVGSVTVVADASGRYEVLVYSNLSGKKTVTVTAGAATKTVDLTFGGVATTAGTAITITAPATVVPGSTIKFTGKLVDKFGNPVATAVTANNATPDFKVVYAGAGFAAQTLPIDTDAAGEFTVSIVTGTNDSGTAVLTATYGGSKGAFDSTVTGLTADIVKSATVTIAPAVAPEAAATITGATKKINLTIDNSKGEYVVIKVGNKTVKTFTAYSNAHAFGIKAAKGTQAVKVYVAGDLVAAKTVSVK